MIWVIGLICLAVGFGAHYLMCDYQVKRYRKEFEIQHEKLVLDLIAKVKSDLIYRLNHEGIKPISTTSQGLVDIIMWGLSHYIDLLMKLPKPQASPIRTITQGLLDIRNQELVMLSIKMSEMKAAISKILTEDTVLPDVSVAQKVEDPGSGK